MADQIRLRGGSRAGMPLLADREPAFVRDEEALYIGSAGGNVKLCAAATEGRVQWLEEGAARHGQAITALEAAGSRRDTDLTAHDGRLAQLEGESAAQGRQLTEQSALLTAQGEAITAHADTLTAQGDTITAHAAALTAQGDTITAHTAALTALEQQTAALETAGRTQGEALAALGREKLTAVAAAPVDPPSAEDPLSAVAEVCARLIAAMKAAGLMQA